MHKEQEKKEEGFLSKVFSRFNFFGIFGTAKNGKPLSPEEIAALDETEQGKKMAADIKNLLAPPLGVAQEADKKTEQPNPTTAEATKTTNSEMTKEEVTRMIAEANAAHKLEIEALNAKILAAGNAQKQAEAAKNAADVERKAAEAKATEAAQKTAEAEGKLEQQKEKNDKAEIDKDFNAKASKSPKGANSPFADTTEYKDESNTLACGKTGLTGVLHPTSFVEATLGATYNEAVENIDFLVKKLEKSKTKK